MPIKAEDIKLGASISLLSKGVNGSGKTIASCGKEFRPVYVFDMENRMDSVINYYRKLDGHVKDVEYDVFPMGRSWHDINSRMDDLVKSCPYKTISVASLTSYIHYILKNTITAKSGATRKSGQQAGKFIGGIPVNELEDYNAEDAGIIYELISFLQTLKSQGCNVIMEAHISPYEMKIGMGPDAQVQTIMQVLTKGKKAPAQIPGYFNEIYLFEKNFEGMVVGHQEHKYTVNTLGDKMNACKTSMGIQSFDWTNKDFSVEMMKQLSTEVKANPRADGNIPKMVSF